MECRNLVFCVALLAVLPPGCQMTGGVYVRKQWEDPYSDYPVEAQAKLEVTKTYPYPHRAIDRK